MAVAEDLLDGFTGVDFLQHVQVHVMTQLVISSYLSYAKGHQEAPFMWQRQSILRTVCHIWTSFSYLNGIDRKGPHPAPSVWCIPWVARVGSQGRPQGSPPRSTPPPALQ